MYTSKYFHYAVGFMVHYFYISFEINDKLLHSKNDSKCSLE